MTFYTLFPPSENVHLVKDVGMYPETLAKYEGVDAHLVCYENGDYPYLGTEVQYLKIDFLQTGKSGKKNEIIDGVRFIKNHALEIDVLNIYHLNLSSFFYAMAFSRYKKATAKLYLKLDADLREIDRMRGFGVVQWIKKKTIKLADIVTVESTVLRRELNSIIGSNKIQYLPDGIDVDAASSVDEVGKKEDIILTVGRLGTTQKNTESLVRRFIEEAPENYKLWLVGSATDDFIRWLDETKNKLEVDNPNLAARIEYLGEITDRLKLDEVYKKAKIFALPSRWESFGIVLVEAMYQGCYLMTSDEVPSTKDLMNGLEEYAPGSKEYIEGAKNRVVEEFSYKAISHRLMQMIRE